MIIGKNVHVCLIILNCPAHLLMSVSCCSKKRICKILSRSFVFFWRSRERRTDPLTLLCVHLPEWLLDIPMLKLAAATYPATFEQPWPLRLVLGASMSTADWYQFSWEIPRAGKNVRKNPKWDGLAILESRIRKLILIMACLFFYLSTSCRFSYENWVVLFVSGILINRFISQSVKYSVILNNESQTPLQCTVLESVSDKAQWRTPTPQACNESSAAELPRGKLSSEQLRQMSTYIFSDRKSFFFFLFFLTVIHKQKFTTENYMLTSQTAESVCVPLNIRMEHSGVINLRECTWAGDSKQEAASTSFSGF